MTMWPTQWIYVILGLLLVISNDAQTCSNGIDGVEDAGACCVAACGTCGDSGCGDRARDAGLSGSDCCVGAIRDAGVYCDDSMTAPCLIGSDPEGNICESNGLPGIEVSGICCAPGCLQCGGVGCGTMAPNVGLTAADCCIGPITSAGVLCDDSGINGVFGVEADDACCVTQCDRCGGVGCSSRAAAAGLTADDCCVGRIRDSGVSCDDTMEAPCLIDVGDMCSNGIPGIETSGVCCVATCPQCSGVGCGSMASTVGLDSGDCCVGVIMAAGESCDDTMMAPCVIDDDDDGVCGPALTITLEWSETDSDLYLYVTEPGGEVVRFVNMVRDVGFLDMDVRQGPGVETYTIFSGLDADMLEVIGAYQLQARRFSGETDTMWTLTALLVESMVLSETGDFVDDNNLTASRSNIFTVSVTAYDSTCEDGTEAFASGSRDSTSSPEDKLP